MSLPTGSGVEDRCAGGGEAQVHLLPPIRAGVEREGEKPVSLPQQCRQIEAPFPHHVAI